MADTKKGMVQANDLRIGNWFSLLGLTYQSTGVLNKGTYYISKRGIGDSFEYYENIQPIPLTEEILLKCGFEKEVNYVKGITIQDGIAYFDDNEFGHSKEDEIECKYLHQLQNLYFSLTQKELTINF